jgi:hypothetical protein
VLEPSPINSSQAGTNIIPDFYKKVVNNKEDNPFGEFDTSTKMYRQKEKQPREKDIEEISSEGFTVTQWRNIISWLSNRAQDQLKSAKIAMRTATEPKAIGTTQEGLDGLSAKIRIKLIYLHMVNDLHAILTRLIGNKGGNEIIPDNLLDTGAGYGAEGAYGIGGGRRRGGDTGYGDQYGRGEGRERGGERSGLSVEAFRYSPFYAASSTGRNPDKLYIGRLVQAFPNEASSAGLNIYPETISTNYWTKNWTPEYVGGEAASLMTRGNDQEGNTRNIVDFMEKLIDFLKGVYNTYANSEYAKNQTNKEIQNEKYSSIMSRLLGMYSTFSDKYKHGQGVSGLLTSPSK